MRLARASRSHTRAVRPTRKSSGRTLTIYPGRTSKRGILGKRGIKASKKTLKRNSKLVFTHERIERTFPITLLYLAFRGRVGVDTCPYLRCNFIYEYTHQLVGQYIGDYCLSVSASRCSCGEFYISTCSRRGAWRDQRLH